MSLRKILESHSPEEKFQHGVIWVILFESFGDGAEDPRKVVHKKLLIFEGLIQDGLAEAFRAWKCKKRI